MILYFLLLAFFVIVILANKYITDLIYNIISEIKPDEPDEKTHHTNKK